jgi:GNAT superfamily N-acetyltransferase
VLHLRAATPADADVLAGTVTEGFASYRSFAPAGWRPPDRLELALGIAIRLGQPHLHAWIGEEDGAPVGHVVWLPASSSRHPSDEPGLAHLEQLFVRPAAWGGGAAHALMDRALAEAAQAGFTAMRLATPVGADRARRFYERGGWRLTAEPFADAALGLELVEYRHGLGAR